uniref:Uncharacterized protein n=1 Tax=Setaria viridis TaxID=4556 RepID=A0A4U6U3Y1_SETVI|nr:hypothetical protein SEVIR_6G153100v2 [Setaria viridis]
MSSSSASSPPCGLATPPMPPPSPFAGPEARTPVRPPSRGSSPWPPPSPWGCFSSPLSCCCSGTARAATQWPERLLGMKKAPGGRRRRVLRTPEDAAVRMVYVAPLPPPLLPSPSCS